MKSAKSSGKCDCSPGIDAPANISIRGPANPPAFSQAKPFSFPVVRSETGRTPCDVVSRRKSGAVRKGSSSLALPASKKTRAHSRTPYCAAASVCVGPTPARNRESVCHPLTLMKLPSVSRPDIRRNFIGRNVARHRYQRGWTQDLLVAKMQIHGCDITRDILASIETLRSIATDKQVWYFAIVLGVDIKELYHPMGTSPRKP
jgi:hypothetical protein